MENSICVKIEGDGNCLFRCFSYFLYNNQNYHRIIRLRIVEHIVDNWDKYKQLIIGNSDYIDDNNNNKTVSLVDEYKKLMSKDAFYGTSIEIKGFCEIYNVCVEVFTKILKTNVSLGNIESNFKINLLLSGPIDSGHYDILSCQNENINEYLKIIKNRKYNNKRKHNSNDNYQSKKI